MTYSWNAFFVLPNAIATAVLAQAASQTRAPEHSLLLHNLFIYSSDVLHRNLYVSTYVVSLRTVCLAFLRHSRPTRLPSCFVRHSRPTRLPSCFVNFDPRASLNDFGFQGKPAACHSVSFAPQHHQLPQLKTMPHSQLSQHHASSTAAPPPPPHPLLLEQRSDQDP